MFIRSLKIIALVLPLSFSAFAANDMDALGKVNINTANAEMLDKELKYVGPNTAQRIVEFRKEHGEFKSIDELTEVRGVGMQVIKANRDRLSIE